MQRVLYITQEMEPFVPETDLSEFTKAAAQAVHGSEYEVRVFMPRYGCINERKHQLHEVIRLSGININVNGIQHELLVKVASLIKSKIQVYFVNNGIFFSSREILKDIDGVYLKENEDRAIFFAKGTLETIEKLAWEPSIIHVHGWFSVFALLFLRTHCKDNPFFKGAKIVYSIYPSDFEDTYSTTLNQKLQDRRIRAQHLQHLSESGATVKDLHRLAIANSDAVIFVGENPDQELMQFAQEQEKIVAENPLNWIRKPDELRDLYFQIYSRLKSRTRAKKKTTTNNQKLDNVIIE